MSINNVTLLGRLTRDPELRYSAGGSAVCKLSLAINEEWTDKATGQKKKETTFINVTVFGKSGENCANYLSKGRECCVVGKLRQHNWEAEDGSKRSIIEVVANQVEFIGGAGEKKGAAAAPREQAEDDDLPL